jgi:hypothetical protein
MVLDDWLGDLDLNRDSETNMNSPFYFQLIHWVKNYEVTDAEQPVASILGILRALRSNQWLVLFRISENKRTDYFPFRKSELVERLSDEQPFAIAADALTLPEQGAHGRHVCKGEKGIQIIAPIAGKKKADDSQPEDERKDSQVFGFRAVYVFDLAQTDGEDLPSAPGVQGDATEHLNALLEFVRQQGIVVEFSEAVSPALGLSCGGKILLAPGHSEAETLATLVHEYAHESMHKADRRTSTTKTIRETEAEAVAFTVCSGLGLDCGSSSSDYIGIYDGNADTLIASLEIVQKTACQILDALTPATRPEWGECYWGSASQASS